jgi:hypothetical protein
MFPLFVPSLPFSNPRKVIRTIHLHPVPQSNMHYSVTPCTFTLLQPTKSYALFIYTLYHKLICTIQLHPVHVQCKLSIMSYKLKCDVNQTQNSNKIRY